MSPLEHSRSESTTFPRATDAPSRGTTIKDFRPCGERTRPVGQERWWIGKYGSNHSNDLKRLSLLSLSPATAPWPRVTRFK
jgi:hypothetical protein